MQMIRGQTLNEGDTLIVIMSFMSIGGQFGNVLHV